MQSQNGKLSTPTKLYLIIVEAHLTRDTEAFGKMDPYCKMIFGGKKFKTKTKGDAGKKPVWNMGFELDVKNIDDGIEFHVMDEDTFTDDPIGSGKFALREVLGPNNFENTIWKSITHEGVEAGRISIKTTMAWPKGDERLLGGAQPQYQGQAQAQAPQ